LLLTYTPCICALNHVHNRVNNLWWLIQGSFIAFLNVISIISHEVGQIDLFRLRLIVSLKDSQDILFRFCYNLTLILTSLCCFFFLPIIGNFICIFLVSRQLPELLHSLVVQDVVLSFSSENFYLYWCQWFFILFSKGPNFTSI
jgi:hypothetical protein